jgi:hypothetical protein
LNNNLQANPEAKPREKKQCRGVFQPKPEKPYLGKKVSSIDDKR